jgi:hypothetical protein
MDKDTVRNSQAFPSSAGQGMTIQDLTRVASMMTLVSCGVRENLADKAEELSESAIELLSRKNGDS